MNNEIKENVLQECFKSKNGVILIERHFKKHFPEIYDDLNIFLDTYYKGVDMLFIQKLYNYFYNLTEIPKTPCGKNKILRNFRHGYNNFCSANCDCSIKHANKVRVENSMKKNGVPYPTQLKEVRDKISNTKLNYTKEKKKEIADKQRKTLKEHFGDSYGKIIEERFMKKHGVRNPSQIPGVTDKVRKTHDERYGGIGFASEELSNKAKDTNEILNGDRNYNNREQIEKTCEERYKSKCYLSSKKGRQHVKEVFLEKYNVDNPSKLDFVRKDISEKVKKYCNKKTLENNPEILEIKEKTFIVKCDEFCSCGGSFEISQYLFFQRKRYGLELCIFKNPVFNYSMKQGFVGEYIKSIYDGRIIENDRKALGGREIDIFLPDLNLGFEFNGDFWHMDPGVYDPEFVNPTSKVMAKDKWKEDVDKLNLAKSLGINLVVIWEHEWDSNPEMVKHRIYEVIKNH